MVKIGNDWDEMLAGEWDKPYYAELRSFLLDEYRKGTVYPPQTDIFNAL
jgi:uracil-DNA glycosylase